MTGTYPSEAGEDQGSYAGAGGYVGMQKLDYAGQYDVPAL